MKEKLVEYLKSDTYLYAPLEDIQHRNDFAVKTVISPPRSTVPDPIPSHI